MSDVKRFDKLAGKISVSTTKGGTLDFTFEGSRLPQAIAELPAYVAKLMSETVSGITDVEKDDSKGLIETLQRKVAELSDENDLLKKKRSTRRG